MYVVVENTPGYLPEDTDPASFEYESEAQEYARELAMSHLDPQGVTDEEGKASVEQESPSRWRISWPSQPNSLDRVVEVMDTKPDPTIGCGCSNCCC